MISFLTKKIEASMCKLPFLKRFLKPYYLNLVLQEIELANINSDDHVLCIGGGPMPITAIYIHQHTNAKVTVIDYDKRAVKLAKQHIEYLNLNENIIINCVKGEIADLNPYTVIHIAKQVAPRNIVFNHILNNCRQGTKVLIRNHEEDLTLTKKPISFLKHTKRLVKKTCYYVI